jgi:endonuclease-8
VPEGHTLHRLAVQLSSAFGDRRVAASSPQGRFAQGSAVIDAARLLSAHAHGKHLFVTFGKGRARHLLHVHLGLYGSFEVVPRSGRQPVVAPRGQVRLRLIGSAAVADLRGPTVCELLDPDQYDALLARLGPDPLHGGEGDAAYARIRASRRPIAALLMQQDVVAGVGNVYRAEVLFRHGIDPFLPGSALGAATWDEMWNDLQVLMARGVENGRIDTVRDDHLPDAMGRPERIDRHGGEVYVYRRSGEPCLLCGVPIVSTVLDGRNLFWCRSCQSAREGRVLSPRESVPR